MANRAIRYRVYPNKEQEIMFAKTFGCCRKVYNLMLLDNRKYYREHKKSLYQKPTAYKEEYPYLKEVDSLALCNVQLNLKQGFVNHFKHPELFGLPTLKSKKSAKKSYTTNNQKGTIAIIDNVYIKLPKIGKVKANIHRTPKEDWMIKSATISQAKDGKYYISVLFEYENTITSYTVDENNAIGLDYKSDGLYMDSNGNKGTNHKYYRESHKKLARQQRKLSRRKGSKKNEPKSNNYKKQQIKVNKIHSKIANQRLDNLHKISTKIANSYDIVCIETLNMKAMSNKGFGNGKSTMDNGFGMFRTMLDYKLSDRRKILVKVDKWYPSSQICSCCGRQKKIPLSVRTYDCECGNHMDRDLNAAINILNEGKRLLKEDLVA